MNVTSIKLFVSPRNGLTYLYLSCIGRLKVKFLIFEKSFFCGIVEEVRYYHNTVFIIFFFSFQIFGFVKITTKPLKLKCAVQYLIFKPNKVFERLEFGTGRTRTKKQDLSLKNDTECTGTFQREGVCGCHERTECTKQRDCSTD